MAPLIFNCALDALIHCGDHEGALKHLKKYRSLGSPRRGLRCVACAPWSQVFAWSLKVVGSAYGVVFMFQAYPDSLFGQVKVLLLFWYLRW
jgi:hypothetical protein